MKIRPISKFKPIGINQRNSVKFNFSRFNLAGDSISFKSDKKEPKSFYGTEKLSDGTKIRTERFFQQGYITERKCIENKNQTKTRLDFTISDLNNKKLVDVHRTFEFKNNKSITTLNGKKYEADFDDKNMIVKIIDDEGNKNSIDVKNKIRLGEYDLIWNLMKKTPADCLLNLLNIKSLFYDEHAAFFYKSGGAIAVEGDLSTFIHELGHYKDGTNNGKFSLSHICEIEDKTKKNWEGAISDKPDIVESYMEEFENLKKNINEDEMKNLAYFSQTGGSAGSGLSEMVAEVNMLCTTISIENFEARAMYLIKYFPKTISKIVKELGY